MLLGKTDGIPSIDDLPRLGTVGAGGLLQVMAPGAGRFEEVLRSLPFAGDFPIHLAQRKSHPFDVARGGRVEGVEPADFNPDATRQHQEAPEAREAGEEGQAQRAGGVTAPRGVLVWISLCLHGGMPSISHSISVAINYNKI